MLEAFAVSDVGCVRANNEDYCLSAPELGLYVLADGMGGAQAPGETASRLAADSVAESIRAIGERDSQALLAAVEEANRRVLAAGRADPALNGMGTTLVAALETGSELLIASVGDSRAYILDGAGFRLITEDQTWVNEVGRRMGLDARALETHPMRHMLTMAIGGGEMLAAHFYSVPLDKGAVVLLCSDGLHGTVQDSSVEQLLRPASQGATLATCCHNLVQAAKTAGGTDNISVLLLRNDSSQDGAVR